jgi:hypothetical protein
MTDFACAAASPLLAAADGWRYRKRRAPTDVAPVFPREASVVGAAAVVVVAAPMPPPPPPRRLFRSRPAVRRPVMVARPEAMAAPALDHSPPPDSSDGTSERSQRPVLLSRRSSSPRTYTLPAPVALALGSASHALVSVAAPRAKPRAYVCDFFGERTDASPAVADSLAIAVLRSPAPCVPTPTATDPPWPAPLARGTPAAAAPATSADLGLRRTTLSERRFRAAPPPLAFVGSERKRERRETLVASACSQCAAFYEALHDTGHTHLEGLGPRSTCEHVSRHRTYAPPTDTPDFYWHISSPSAPIDG